MKENFREKWKKRMKELGIHFLYLVNKSMRKESIGLFLIIIAFIVILIAGYSIYSCYRKFLDCHIAILITQFASVIVLFVTVYFIYRQAENTKELGEITSRPHISVGIISSNNDSYDEALLNTHIVLRNLSNFTAFVWTRVKLEINKVESEEYNKCIRIPGYFFDDTTWEIDPNQSIIVRVFKNSDELKKDSKSILEYKDRYYKDDSLNISIHIYFSDIRLKNLPPIQKWTELTAYSFRKNGNKWLKNNLGISFSIQRLFTK